MGRKQMSPVTHDKCTQAGKAELCPRLLKQPSTLWLFSYFVPLPFLGSALLTLLQTRSAEVTEGNQTFLALLCAKCFAGYFHKSPP